MGTFLGQQVKDLKVEIEHSQENIAALEANN